jgi:AcrR family transcriptional regulator
VDQTNIVGKQEAKSERARNTICKATVACLGQIGYAETSINRVVEQAGVSKGALQHHFPSKEDLMASTAAYLLQKSLRYADTAKVSRDPGDIRSRLLKIWDTLIDTRAYLALLEILIASRTDKVLHQRIAYELEASIHQIDDSFLALYGELDESVRGDVKLIMTANRCFMRGLLIERQYGLSKGEQRRVLERWLDLVVPVLEVEA